MSASQVQTMIVAAAAVWCLPAFAGDACGADDPRVGYEATLATLAHGVSGTARIVDNCTIAIEHFNYDGGGVDVRVYGFQDLNYTSPVVLTGDIRRQTPYVDETLMVPLPNGVTLDDVPVISIWCVAVSASFGDGTFAPTGDADPCDFFPVSSALDSFYTDFGLTGGANFDLVGLGMPVNFGLALAEESCVDNDTGRLIAVRTAYLLNVDALAPLATGTSLEGNVEIVSFLALLSEAMRDAVLGALAEDGIDTNGLSLLFVECDAIGCTPFPDAKGAVVFEKGSATTRPYAEIGDFDGDGVTNLVEAQNVLARGGDVNDFAQAATDPALDGILASGGCFGAGASNPPASPMGSLILVGLCAFSLAWRGRCTGVPVSKIR